MLLLDLPELRPLSHQRIAVLAGVALFNCDSGTLRGRRAIWGGRTPSQGALYMATLVVFRHSRSSKPSMHA